MIETLIRKLKFVLTIGAFILLCLCWVMATLAFLVVGKVAECSMDSLPVLEKWAESLGALAVTKVVAWKQVETADSDCAGGV